MIFKGKTEEQVHDIIKDARYDGERNLTVIGYEYGIAYKSAGFQITDETPLWSEILEINFIEGFKKGYYYKNAIDIIAEGITDNIPNCIGVSIDYPHYINSFDPARKKLVKVSFGIRFANGELMQVSIQSTDRKIKFWPIGPNYFDELINYPLVEINEHLSGKREALDGLFVQYDSKGFYIYEDLF